MVLVLIVLILSILFSPTSVKVVDAGISIYDDDDLGKRGRDDKKERRDRGREGERRRDDRREERRGRLDSLSQDFLLEFSMSKFSSGMSGMISMEETDTGRGRRRRTDTGMTDMQEMREAETRNRLRTVKLRSRLEQFLVGDHSEVEHEWILNSSLLAQVGSSKKPVSYFDKPAEPVEEKKGGFSAEDKELIKAMMKKEEMEVLTEITTEYSKSISSGKKERREEVRGFDEQ